MLTNTQGDGRTAISDSPMIPSVSAVNGSAMVTRVASRVHGAFDFRVVDGLVNLTASIIHAFGGAMRRLQTGSINAYLYTVVVVVTAVLFAKAW